MEIIKINSNWWSFAFSGLIAIIYALLALLIPGESAQGIVKVSGIVIALIGVICLLLSLRRRKKMLPWGMLLFEAIVMIAMGSVAIFWSQEVIKLVIFAIGLWSAIIGAFMLLVIFNMKNLMIRGFYVMCAFLSLAFGILLIVNPFGAAKVFVIISGIIALVFGIIMMMFGFALRRYDKETPTAEIVE